MLGYAKISSKTSRVGSSVQGENSIYYNLKSRKRYKSHPSQQNVIFKHYYQSYGDYLLKLVRTDEEQAVFER